MHYIKAKIHGEELLKCILFSGNLLTQIFGLPRVLREDYMQNFRAQGPVVQSWISANPGLKFNPLFKFVYFCISVYYENH